MFGPRTNWYYSEEPTPWCIRYELRNNPYDSFYYVLLDCIRVSLATPVQVYFTPFTSNPATLNLGGGTTTTHSILPTSTEPLSSQTPIATTPTISSSASTTPPPSQIPSTTSSFSFSPSTTESPTTIPAMVPSNSQTSHANDSSGSGSTGLSTGDKAGIASAVIASV